MPLIPQSENDHILGQILFVAKDALLDEAYAGISQHTDYILTLEKTLLEAAKSYRLNPSHLIILHASFGLDALASFIDDIRSTHKNQLFMLVLDDFDEVTIRWSIDHKIDQLIIKPHPRELLVELVTKLVDAKKMLRSFVIVQKRLNAYDSAINQAFLISKSDLKGVMIEVNDAFCQVSGYTQEELVGKSYKMIASQNRSTAIIKELWQTLLNRQIFKGRIENRSKQGEMFICDMVVFPIIDENDEICEFVSFMQDVTSFVQTGRQLIEERTRHEKQLNNIKDYYLELFSKELRTPTHSILNFSEEVSTVISKSDLDEKDEMLYALSVVHENGAKIMELVASLLNISRIRSGEEEVRPSIVNANECFPEAVEKLNKPIVENGVAIDYHFSDMSRIRTDKTKFQIIIDSLLSNAIRYGDDKISISFTTNSNGFECSIEDNGRGIHNKKELLLMFESQDLLGMSENAHGIGLGLYMTKLLCTMLKFDFTIEDSLNLGGAKVIIKGPIDYEALKPE